MRETEDSGHFERAVSRLPAAIRLLAKSPAPRDTRPAESFVRKANRRHRWGLVFMAMLFGGGIIVLFAQSDGHYGCAAVPSVLLAAVPVLYFWWLRINTSGALKLVEEGRMGVGRVADLISYYVRSARVDVLEIRFPDEMRVPDGTDRRLIGSISGARFKEWLTRGEPIVLFWDEAMPERFAAVLPEQGIWVGKTRPTARDE